MSSHVTRLENLLEAVPEALVGVDQSGVIRFINHQTESLFGYERGRLIGKLALPFAGHPGFRDEWSS